MNTGSSLTLLAAWLSLGLSTACRDRVDSLPVEVPDSTGVASAVVIAPSSAAMNVGDTITLVATLPLALRTTNRGVTWTVANIAVATVDARGAVTAVGGGTTTVVATSVADPSVKGAASITVGSILIGPEISTISQDGKPAVLSNVSGTLDVVVDLPGGIPTYSTVGLLLVCGATETVVATKTVATTVSAQSISLSFNTAAYKNGPCGLKARATASNGVIVLSSATPITLNNPSASAALLGAEYLRDSRFQRVQILSQSLIALYRIVPDSLIHARGHAGEIRDLRL